MAWSISDLFPPWGDAGERPSDNFQYDGGDQVNEKHLDYLWDSVSSLESETRSALQDIDSDQDGVVDQADVADSASALSLGDANTETIAETTSPKSFNFSGSSTRDISESIDVHISNSSGSSATEDVTVELYDGSDTTGTLLDSETISVTVADGGNTTETFLAVEHALDSGTYHVEVTQSGADLTVDQTDVNVTGATYDVVEQNDGSFAVVNEDAEEVFKFENRPNGGELFSVSARLTLDDGGIYTGSGDDGLLKTVTHEDATTGGYVLAERSGGATAMAQLAYTDSGPPEFEAFRARGTAGSPSAVTAGDNLWGLKGHGYSPNGNFVAAGEITLEATGSISGNVVPGRMRVNIRDDSDNLLQRLAIGQDFVDFTNLTAVSIHEDGTPFRFGASRDMGIYYDGTNSWLGFEDTGTANDRFRIREGGGVDIPQDGAHLRFGASQDVSIRYDGLGGNLAVNTSNGDSFLVHDNGLVEASTDMTVGGTLNMTNSGQLINFPAGDILGGGTNSELQADSGPWEVTGTGGFNVNTPMTVTSNADFSGGDKMTLPHRSTDPSASPGDMWYRTDLD